MFPRSDARWGGSQGRIPSNAHGKLERPIGPGQPTKPTLGGNTRQKKKKTAHTHIRTATEGVRVTGVGDH